MSLIAPATLTAWLALTAMAVPGATHDAFMKTAPEPYSSAPMPASLLLPPPEIDVEEARAVLIERAPGQCLGAEGKLDVSDRPVAVHRFVTEFDRNREIVLPGGVSEDVPFHSVLFRFDCSVFDGNVVSMFLLLDGQHGYFIRSFAVPFMRYGGPPVLGMDSATHLPNAAYNPATGAIEAGIDYGEGRSAWQGTWRMIGSLPLLTRYRQRAPGGTMKTVYEAEPWPDPRQ